MIASERGQQVTESGAEFRFEPAFGLDAKERIFVHAVAMTACEEPRAEFAAKVRSFVGQRGFIGAGTEGDLLLMGEGVRVGPVTHAGKFKAMEDQADFGCGARADFDARSCVDGKQLQEGVDAGIGNGRGPQTGKRRGPGGDPGCRCRGIDRT